MRDPVPDPTLDDDLVARSRAGDAAALAELYRRHAGALLGYLEWRAGSRPEAEDTVHETFLRLFEGRGQYEPRGQFRAWLFRVATRIVTDRGRTHKRRNEILRASVELEPAVEAVEVHLGRRLQARIDAILAQLPPETALAFQLRVRENMPYRDIAAECGEPEGTLRSRVHHAIHRVRSALQLDARSTPKEHHDIQPLE